MKHKRDSLFFIIESSFPEYTGGIENWLWNVSVRMADKYDIHIVSESTSIYKNSFYEIPDKIDLLRYRTWRGNPVMRFLLRRGKLRKLEILMQSRSIKRLLENNVKNSSKTILFALGTITPSLAAFRYKKAHPDVLYVSSSRGPHAEVETTAIPALKKFFYYQEQNNMKNADVVFVNGYDTKKYYESFGIIGDVLLNGVDADRIEKSDLPSPYDTKYQSIVSVGSLLDIKGVNELIKAFSIIDKKDNNSLLYFVGKGDPSKYKALASELGVLEKVFFLGNKSDVAPYLKHADVIACLSGGGGFSMAALEAMSSKRPIVAWDTDVYRQFNKDVNTMVLVEYNNVPQLADRISAILKQPGKYSEMSVNANMISHMFSWENVIKIMDETFNHY